MVEKFLKYSHEGLQMVINIQLFWVHAKEYIHWVVWWEYGSFKEIVKMSSEVAVHCFHLEWEGLLDPYPYQNFLS